MKNATFYLIAQYTSITGLTAVERLACYLAAKNWQEGKWSLIACENDVQATKLDEALWATTPNAFVPHNLSGEGPSYGAPVEICWPQCRGNVPRELLISLLPTCADFAFSFQEVIDFVPNQDALKELARDRYKAYRRSGFLLTTAESPTQLCMQNHE
ncbi:DNA polymerase III subunit chi [secondary endosymbiont of Ctenarytaina eucalypti]|uniref:DNA polymerase III, chi subunit n=1 Tax=secondary endosymbiont of Ctenarytaina eucalypti TaxID=1199245 RepID=J3Z492_9ENTR|nr:DNA polymerase III subunit chi [secondary endosymbiont of Ctenarytaina eucalypti]AFP85109.1 DNA polymerase III, chi subunit [secondary endosymbiont of Ctenarytaina eucalypti]